MAKLISQLCGELQPAVCLSRKDGAIWRSPKQSWMSDKPQKQTTAKTAWATFSTKYLSELLVSLFSYCVMVKSVSCCCVCGRWIFSNTVTIDHPYYWAWHLLSCCQKLKGYQQLCHLWNPWMQPHWDTTDIAS